jgi:hypothetical protein
VAEWPVASVARTDIVDPVLWEDAAHDPRLYTFFLRQQGELSPLYAPIDLPLFKIPLSPLGATVLP